jgi:hypothetical protein
VLYAFIFAMSIQSPGTAVALEVCSLSSIDVKKQNGICNNVYLMAKGPSMVRIEIWATFRMAILN